MKRPEEDIKAQFSKLFVKRDFAVFKKLAEYYLRQAAELKTEDIKCSTTNSLWIRNVQKRLFIGIACELLLKSAYLKCGYMVNKPKDKTKYGGVNHKLDSISADDLKSSETFSFNELLDNYKTVLNIEDEEIFEKGFRIAKVFRNKEGHVAIHWHNYERQNYTDIEESVKLIYKNIFNRVLEFQISFENNEQSIFEIKKVKH